jgi:hypothetical protein
MNLPELTVEMIKRWVRAFHTEQGEYPTYSSGKIAGTNGETWGGVHSALKVGYRSLPGGSSLASFLENEFGQRNVKRLPDFTRDQLRGWIFEFFTKLNQYPTAESGEIPGADGDTWRTVNLALWKGYRGFPGGSSLAKFISEEFGVRNRGNLSRLTVDGIRQWVTEWFDRTGNYPKRNDGEIPGTNGETWAAVSDNLACGSRGLPGGSSLPRFLEQEFGVRNRLNPPELTLARIAELITAWRETTGEFPTTKSGAIPGLNGTTWGIVDKALRRGSRGLPGGSSLPQILEQQFNARNVENLPLFTHEQIRSWIIEYHQETGKYPVVLAGEIPGSDGETWRIVDRALCRGQRGLPGGSSLFKFIEENFRTSDGGR